MKNRSIIIAIIAIFALCVQNDALAMVAQTRLAVRRLAPALSQAAYTQYARVPQAINNPQLQRELDKAAKQLEAAAEKEKKFVAEIADIRKNARNYQDLQKELEKDVQTSLNSTRPKPYDIIYSMPITLDSFDKYNDFLGSVRLPASYRAERYLTELRSALSKNPQQEVNIQQKYHNYVADMLTSLDETKNKLTQEINYVSANIKSRAEQLAATQSRRATLEKILASPNPHAIEVLYTYNPTERPEDAQVKVITDLDKASPEYQEFIRREFNNPTGILYKDPVQRLVGYGEHQMNLDAANLLDNEKVETARRELDLLNKAEHFWKGLQGKRLQPYPTLTAMFKEYMKGLVSRNA